MLNQFAVIIYLGFIAYNGHYIESNYLVHFLSLSLLFFDAAYISYKNVKCNKVLNHFSLLLLLLGWQFLLYLFDFRPISKAVSMLLLPVCFYQSAYFIQTFLFQSSAYRGQKALLAFFFQIGLFSQPTNCNFLSRHWLLLSWVSCRENELSLC